MSTTDTQLDKLRAHFTASLSTEFPSFTHHHDAAELVEYLHRRDADAVSELLDARSPSQRLGLLHGLIDLLHDTQEALQPPTYEALLAQHVARWTPSEG